jgi:cold-inducible RNA-binding protein
MVNIFVGNLSFKTSEEELRREVEAFGEVSSCKIITDRETRKSRGFAFVEMPNQDQAAAAITGLNGKDLDGQTLKVNEAKPREARSGPGQSRERSGGGFGFASRGSSTYDQKGADIYDQKDRRGGGGGNRGRGGRGSGGGGGGGGRSGGGRRSH